MYTHIHTDVFRFFLSFFLLFVHILSLFFSCFLSSCTFPFVSSLVLGGKDSRAKVRHLQSTRVYKVEMLLRERKEGKKLTRTYKVSRILKTLDTSTNVIRTIFSFSIYLFSPALYCLQIHSDRLSTFLVRSSANQWKIRFLENV